ncbi:transglutaminase-like domain-containing protein [Arabiibacter massiliensis]|uniref:transglutaminase-like domain-containing protein n=1 Tax=Arabiibacter massiliensis TaxID=1870985 RepID=UPI00155AA046|nr:transglutaminase domain-containing protein [Arabiibacter massiliensis]
MKRLGARRYRLATATRRASVVALAFALALTSLAGCAGAGGGTAAGETRPGAANDEGTTSGPTFERPPLAASELDADAATADHDSLIDVSHAAQGYVAASAQNENRMKLLVSKDGQQYNYDLPGDGTPLAAPLNMGDGAYEVSVMQNTSGNSYVAVNSVTVDVAMDSEFEPFLRPNVFCDYDEDSACVAKADELAAGAQNQGDVLRAIYDWITANISYDTAKAQQLADATGYVPDPDATLFAGTGVCFDYVSLGAAMLRSQGIPTKIITGYVSPDEVYHAWNLVYLDGSWKSVQVDVEANTWTRIDLTFAAGGATQYVGDAKEYTDRFTY